MVGYRGKTAPPGWPAPGSAAPFALPIGTPPSLLGKAVATYSALTAAFKPANFLIAKFQMLRFPILDPLPPSVKAAAFQLATHQFDYLLF